MDEFFTFTGFPAVASPTIGLVFLIIHSERLQVCFLNMFFFISSFGSCSFDPGNARQHNYVQAVASEPGNQAAFYLSKSQPLDNCISASFCFKAEYLQLFIDTKRQSVPYIKSQALCSKSHCTKERPG